MLDEERCVNGNVPLDKAQIKSKYSLGSESPKEKLKEKEGICPLSSIAGSKYLCHRYNRYAIPIYGIFTWPNLSSIVKKSFITGLYTLSFFMWLRGGLGVLSTNSSGPRERSPCVFIRTSLL